MGTRYSSGFTIIETVLFLSVTALLVLGVMIGTGTSINNQRYRDSTETFKNLLQEQYGALESVRNGRENTWGCNSAAQPVEGGSQKRGQSNCVIVGRYMQINRGDIKTYTVLARETSEQERGSDVQTLELNYAYAVSEIEVDQRTMEWGTQIGWPVSGAGARPNPTPRSMAILFLRSPDSGAVYTFTSDTIPASGNPANGDGLKAMIRSGEAIPGQSKRTICVKNGGLNPTGDTAVFISAFAAGPSAIETRSNDTLIRLGESTQC